MLERNRGTEKGEEYYGAGAEAHLCQTKGQTFTLGCMCMRIPT